MEAKTVDVNSSPQKIVIGVPFYGGQSPDWWTQVAAEMLRMSSYKTITYPGGEPGPNLEFYASVALRGVAVQNQRNGICDWFLRSPADWLWFIDDDTIPPKGVLGNLFRSRATLVSGLYWGGDPRDVSDDEPFEPFPLVYRRIDNGMYQSLKDWPGVTPEKIHQLIKDMALVQADAAGGGNLLIHRSVLEDIKKTHRIFRLMYTGGLKLVPSRLVKGKQPDSVHSKGPLMEIRNGSMRERVFEVDKLEASEAFPFFIQEHGRTEDLAFFEAAKEAGHQLYVDMGVESKHSKTKYITHKDFNLSNKFEVLR